MFLKARRDAGFFYLKYFNGNVFISAIFTDELISQGYASMYCNV